MGYKIKMIFKKLITIIFNKKTEDNKDLDQELLDIVHSKPHDGSNSPELYILNNIVNIKDQKAIDILTPRVDIIAIDQDIDLDELTNLFIKHGFSRLPVYGESLDDILGFLHVKDLIQIFKKGNGFNIDKILRPVLFVSPYIRILDLLFEMIAKRSHMAMVVDEFGGIDGLITIEDIIEEIVGDIHDEHDKFSQKQITLIKDGYLEADARLALKELEQSIGDFLQDEEKEEVETLGGLIYYLAGRVPTKSEIIIHPSGVEFEILAGDPIKVTKIGVRYNLLPTKKDQKVNN